MASATTANAPPIAQTAGQPCSLQAQAEAAEPIAPHRKLSVM
jgi:hypothetical protein